MADKADKSQWWNMALSVLDPELEKFAEKLANTIPADSPLRATIVVRIIGVLKAWIESKASSMPGFAGAAVEKLTDVADFFAANLTGSKSKKETVKATGDWMDKFFVDAENRIRSAGTQAEMEQEVAKIMAEFTFRREILKILEEARKAEEAAAPKEDETTPASIDWNALNAKLKALIGKFADDAVDAAKWADDKLAPVAGWTGALRGVQTKGKLW